jgi:hypothetical protein
MAEEKTSGPSRTEKQAPSDRQPSGEKPASRPPNGSRPHKGKGDGEGPGKKKSGHALLWIFLALMLAVLVFILYRCQTKEPAPRPPAKLTVNVNDEGFYKAFLASLDYLVRAKEAFYSGQKLMEGAPESVPETASTETMAQSPLFKAATQFASALEQFKHAEDLIKGDNGGPTKTELNVCRDQYLEALEKYQSTAKLYNEHAKAKYQEASDKIEKFALSDANARWDLAEKLMSDFLVKGCDGDIFRYLKDQTPEMRSAVLAQYQKLLGSHYDSYRVQLEGQLGVVTGVASPMPSLVPAPLP